MVGTCHHSVNADVGSHGTILDGSVVVQPTRDATDIVTSCDTSIREINVLDCAVTCNPAEEPMRIGVLIDAYAADGVVVAVEGTLEGVIVITDGCVVVLFAGAVVPVGGVGIGDVAAQLEVEAAAVVAAVHVLRQQVQALGGGDGVRIAL